MANKIRTALNLKEGEYTGEYVEKLERVYEALEKHQKNNEEYINKILKIHAEEVNTLAMRNYELEKALDKACKEWDKEVPNCEFLIIKHMLCDEKCGSCNSKKRKEYRKQWCMKDE